MLDALKYIRSFLQTHSSNAVIQDADHLLELLNDQDESWYAAQQIREEHNAEVGFDEGAQQRGEGEQKGGGDLVKFGDFYGEDQARRRC